MIQPAVKIQVKYKHWILFRDVFEDTQHSGQYSITVLVLMGILRERAHREATGKRSARIERQRLYHYSTARVQYHFFGTECCLFR